jgi:hypothetical protein
MELVSFARLRVNVHLHVNLRGCELRVSHEAVDATKLPASYPRLGDRFRERTSLRYGSENVAILMALHGLR